MTNWIDDYKLLGEDIENLPEYALGEIPLDNVYVCGKGINSKIIFKFYIANKERTEAFCINDKSVTKKVKLIGSEKVDLYNFIGESIDYSVVIKLSELPEYSFKEIRELFFDFGFEDMTNYKEICGFKELLDERLNKKSSNVR